MTVAGEEDVRSPVGVPRSYKPNDLSGHAMLRVELGDFAGPLDLLLHLIREHDLDVFDIPIAFITEKYLAMLDDMSNLPIDVAAEFLVMAAELAHIKSKMLLPPKEGVPVEAVEEEGGDPRADLVRRLLEYQKYREAADRLGGRDQLGRDVFTRPEASYAAAGELEPGVREASIFRLVEAMADVLSRLAPEKQHEIIADTVTISERIAHILERMGARGASLTFLDLFDGITSRRVVVMTFLAILELTKLQILKVVQPLDPETGEPDTSPRALRVVSTGKSYDPATPTDA